MSTILNALKKLEQEREGARRASPGQVYVGPGAAAGGGAGALGWRAAKWIRRGVAILLIMTLAGTSYYYYRQSRHSRRFVPHQATQPMDTRAVQKPPAGLPAPETAPPTPVLSPEQPAAGLPPAAAVRQKSAPPRRPAEQAEKRQPPSPPKAPVRETAATPPVQRRPPTVLTKETAKPPAAPKAPVSGEPRSEERAAATAAAPVQQPAPPQEPQRGTQLAARKQATPSAGRAYENAPLLTDGRLKVQALAWSPLAEDRMAVINTRIVHEGDKVDEFAVLAIGQDDVVVRLKGVVYRIPFGLP